MQQARRMETIGAFASGIAHNFNNIVGAIIGYAEGWSSQRHQVVGRPARNLRAIRRAGERASDLVNQIPNLRQAPDRGSTIDGCTRALLVEATALLRASLPSSIELLVEQTPDPAIVSGEPAQIQQVIVNLCAEGNAAQAMKRARLCRGPPGDPQYRSRPTIPAVTMRQSRPDNTRTRMHGLFSFGRISGLRGRIDAEVGNHLFRAAYRHPDDQGGNGLGLATVREIVRGSPHGKGPDRCTHADRIRNTL